jgi:hypothetical protein
LAAIWVDRGGDGEDDGGNGDRRPGHRGHDGARTGNGRSDDKTEIREELGHLAVHVQGKCGQPYASGDHNGWDEEEALLQLVGE